LKEIEQFTIACGHEQHVEPGERLCREGDPADRFFLIQSGAVALEIAVPGRDALLIETLHAGDLLGWSWLFEPHRWQFDARALEAGDLLVFDGACVRARCEADPALGYEFMQRFAAVMVERLQATRLQLMDVSGHGAGR
jgi:CRP/FNR family transcriptional regulator, cyclic AMP receptor protein